MFYEIKKGEMVLAKKAKMADSIYLRTLGLMFSKGLEGFDALWLKPCNSIHTFFMNYEIDVVFLSKDLTVVKVLRNVKPWRMTGMYFKASQCLEFFGGTLPEGIGEGEKLEAVCIN